MRDKGVNDRLFSGDAVIVAVETDGDDVVTGLNKRYESAPPTLPRERTSIEEATTLGEFADAFNYRQHLDHLLGDLRTVHTRLSAAQDEHQGKLMLLEELYHQRREVGEKLQSVFFKVRHTLETLYSETQRRGRRWRRGFVLASVSGATPRMPRRFLSQVEQTEAFLRKPAVEPPALDLKGVKVDFVDLADDLKPLRQHYSDLINAIDRTQKQADGALEVKKEAIDEYDRVFGWVTRAFESLFSLSGLEKLARRIRPSVRRKGRLAAEEEDADPSPEQASSAEASPAEDSPAESQSPSEVAASAPAES